MMQRLNNLLKILVLVSLPLLAACSSSNRTIALTPQMLDEQQQKEGMTLEKLQAIKQVDSADKNTKTDISRARGMMLRDTALSVSARAGLADQSKAINKMLYGQAKKLDSIYNFNTLMLKDSILPPVILSGDNHLHVATARTLRLADKNYSIIKQAKFVTAAPTWRDYLLMEFNHPEKPPNMLLPKNTKEQKIWQHFVSEGWKKGQEQALETYKQNLARLKRDYEGMIRYKELLAKKMVSAPHVLHRAMGVTGGGDAISVNDRMLTITAEPALNPDARHWKPLM